MEERLNLGESALSMPCLTSQGGHKVHTTRQHVFVVSNAGSKTPLYSLGQHCFSWGPTKITLVMALDGIFRQQLVKEGLMMPL